MTPNERHLNYLLADWANAMRADSYATNTIRVRTETLRSICTAHQAWNGHLTETHLRTYITDRRLGPASVLAYLRHVRAWAEHTGIPDPTAGIRRPRNPDFVPRPLPETDLAYTLRYARGRMRAWITLGAYAGLRAGETATLHAEDFINTGTRTLIRITGKGARTAVVPLSPIVVRELAPFIPDHGGRLWPHAIPQYVSQDFRRHCLTVGVIANYHQLRHRYGTQLYRTTRDLVRTQKLMRHTNPKTTTAYIQLSDDYGRAVDLLPGANPSEQDHP